MRGNPVWARLCLILGGLAMLASATAVVLPRVLANWAISDIRLENLLSGVGGDTIDGAINVLLLGMDERAGNSTEPIRTDTMIIAHIPATHDHVYLISLPRDSEVSIPDFPETGFRGRRTKINAAFAFGNLRNGKPDPSADGRRRGVQLTAMTINQLVPGGLRFNAVAIINFMGFRQILEVLGGVHLCVDERTRSIHFDRNGVYHTRIDNVSQQKVYEVGCRDMAGWEALDFARQRYSVQGGDYGRQRHQQQLLMAIFSKLASQGTLTSPARLIGLQQSAGDLLTLDLGETEIADWAFTLKSLRAQDITVINTNAGIPNTAANGNEILSPATMQLLASVHDDTVATFLSTHPTWSPPPSARS
jgi:LCP family protein required for cell wall assembly